MNRLGMGLAVGAGYVLGRTKKMKLAFAVGTMVAGKRMNLSPRAIGDLLSQQLQNNPQFKEIGDQLRGDLQGVGKAATGALLERQISGLADRLHGRTADVRDQLAGVTPDIPGRGRKDEADDADDAADADAEYDDERDRGRGDRENRGDRDDRDDREGEESAEADSEPEEKPRPRKRAPERKPAPKKAAAKKSPARKPAPQKSAQKSPAKKTAKKAPARAAAKTSARRTTGARLPKEGGRDE
ncbi:DNA primase [Streptomyces sp. NPDC046853]|uniref:DNA primase n=1 Tax=Streptomyces sp. NPDC046853 TaxID=3154920 RepID=UPI00340E10BF